MKTMKLFLLLAGATLLVAGCNKQNPFGGKYSRKDGNPVVFGVGSRNMETRTVYGEVNTSTHIQAIDWVAGDMIRIYSPQAKRSASNRPEQWADYTVTPTTDNASLGTLTNVQNEGLSWGTEGTYNFYAVYPSPEDPEENVPVGTTGAFTFSLPAAQLVTDEMAYAFMTAGTEVTTSGTDAVNLDFYPAFTAFEIHLNSEADLVMKSFKLISADTPLAGAFTVTYSGTTAAYAATGTDKEIEIADLGDVAINATDALIFNVFTLPVKQSGLSVRFTYSRADAPDVTETRMLRLNYANGNPVEFAARKKHVISGSLQGNWYFTYIDLTGQPIDWTELEIPAYNSDDEPQAGQFTVTGEDIFNVYQLHETAAGKKLRQTWVLGANTATVTFKVFSPAGGTWEVVPQGATDKFTVTGDLTGTISERGGDEVTKVTFTVTPNGAAAGDEIWFQTFVTNSEGVKYNIDSETQLYDMRGYHRFRIDDPLQ